MKQEARVFDMTSQPRLKIQCNKACKNNIIPTGMVNSSCKSDVICQKRVRVLMVMAEKEKGRPSRFRLPKSAAEEQVPADEAVSSSTKYKNKWTLKIFRKWQQQREMKVPLIDSGGLFKDNELHKVNPVS